MKNLKIILAIAVAAAVLTMTGAAFAADFKTPLEIVSQLTGKSAESLNTERAEGKTYGAIAKENGKLDEFKKEMQEQKKAILDQRVADGKLTREEADKIYNMLKENMETCDGSGSGGFGRKSGIGFGMAGARNFGNNAGCGMGFGRNARR